MQAWLKKYLAHFKDIDYSTLQAPILTASETQALRDWAIENSPKTHTSPLHKRQSYGEQESVKLGQGMDFEDNRLYQSGDDIKHINWRLTARARELHVKQFNEFQHAIVNIVVDGGGSMRFGSRQRSKIAQACRAALYIAHVAKLRKCSVFGYLAMAPEARNLSACEYTEIESYFNRPYPPIETLYEADTSLPASINRQHGSQGVLVIISDFHFLAAMNKDALAAFTSRVQDSPVFALQIVDALEQQLPKRGIFTLAKIGSKTGVEFNMNDARLHTHFNHAVKNFQQTLEQRLRSLCSEWTILPGDMYRIDSVLHDKLMTLL